MRNKQTPFFSVITINWNDKLGLERTILSVLNQQNADVEYIVIDGGSLDGSVDVIKQYEEKIDFWVSESDNGIYNAMNKGVSHANGEYCLFLNSGDYLYSDAVLCNVKTEIAKNMADFYTGRMLFCKNSRILKRQYIPPNVLDGDYLLYVSLAHQATFIKTTWVKEKPYDETKKVVSDWKHQFECLELGDASYFPLHFNICVFNLEGVSSKYNYETETELVYRELLPERLADKMLAYRKETMRFKRIKYSHPQSSCFMLYIYMLVTEIKDKLAKIIYHGKRNI